MLRRAPKLQIGGDEKAAFNELRGPQGEGGVLEARETGINR